MNSYLALFSSVQLLSCVQLSATPWTAAHLTITNSWSLLNLMFVESMTPSNHLILCHSLHLPPSIFPSIRVFSNESVLHIRWPRYWSFSFSINPSNEHPGLISFRMDWDLLAVQGTLKSLLQHHSSKASILWCSAFFIVQLSHPYMTTRKNIALTRQTFVDKVMSLLFYRLSKLVIVFLTRSKRFNFIAAVTICSDFGAQNNKVSHCFHCFPIYSPWSDETGCHGYGPWLFYLRAIHSGHLSTRHLVKTKLVQDEKLWPHPRILESQCAFKNIPALVDIYPVEHKETPQK